MSTIGSGVDNVSELASAIFKRIDGNGDGKLNASEFRSFLENLLGKVGTTTTGLGSEAAAVKPLATESLSYQPMMGFDHTKLNTLTHTTPKYVFARATQSITVGFDRAARSTGLAQIVENVKQNGYPNAKVIGDDTIDFGDGYGEIDVLTGDGNWWWGPKN